MAIAALNGFPPSLFLETDDEVELTLLTVVAEKAAKVAEAWRQDIAVRIINELSKSLKRGSSKRVRESRSTSSTGT